MCQSSLGRRGIAGREGTLSPSDCPPGRRRRPEPEARRDRPESEVRRTVAAAPARPPHPPSRGKHSPRETRQAGVPLPYRTQPCARPDVLSCTEKIIYAGAVLP